MSVMTIGERKLSRFVFGSFVVGVLALSSMPKAKQLYVPNTVAGTIMVVSTE